MQAYCRVPVCSSETSERDWARSRRARRWRSPFRVFISRADNCNPFSSSGDPGTNCVMRRTRLSRPTRSGNCGISAVDSNSRLTFATVFPSTFSPDPIARSLADGSSSNSSMIKLRFWSAFRWRLSRLRRRAWRNFSRSVIPCRTKRGQCVILRSWQACTRWCPSRIFPISSYSTGTWTPRSDISAFNASNSSTDKEGMTWYGLGFMAIDPSDRLGP